MLVCVRASLKSWSGFYGELLSLSGDEIPVVEAPAPKISAVERVPESEPVGADLMSAFNQVIFPCCEVHVLHSSLFVSVG